MKKEQIKSEVEVLHLFRWFTHTHTEKKKEFWTHNTRNYTFRIARVKFRRRSEQGNYNASNQYFTCFFAGSHEEVRQKNDKCSIIQLSSKQSKWATPAAKSERGIRRDLAVERVAVLFTRYWRTAPRRMSTNKRLEQQHISKENGI